MTRILVQRGSQGGLQGGSQGSSSSNPNRSSTGSSSARSESQVPPQPSRDEDSGEQFLEQVAINEISDSCRIGEDMVEKSENLSRDSSHCNHSEIVIDDFIKAEKAIQDDDAGSKDLMEGFCCNAAQIEGSSGETSKGIARSSHPPPPPVPPPKPASTNLNSRRTLSGSSNDPKIGSSRRAVAWPTVSARTSPTGSRPSSPRSHGESEGYNSSDEQKPCFVSSYDDVERECQFEIDIKRAKGLEVKRMVADGNCLFRAVADQVYGDSELYDLARQLCIDYMERERDHFAQFITEGFTSYCKRKRRDKVYGNNVEIQALAEMYSRPIHIYSYSTEPINIFQGGYDTDSPPIRLSFHQGNHYNSLIDPRRPTIGAGLGFSSLRGANVDKDQVKAAIKAQQDQQIDNALLAEGQFYSDLELTEKEIERMVMEASRAEYLSDNMFNQQLSLRDSSTSSAEPSSSGARPSGNAAKLGGREASQDNVLSRSMQILLSMGFSYLQAIEAYSIFGDDVESMVCYLLEMGNGSRRKGKATK